MDYPVTAAIRMLRQHSVAFTPHQFPYVVKGGTTHSSAVLGVPEHQVIKTLIMEDAERNPLCILMHGDLEVSTKTLARLLGTKSVTPCKPETAEKHSGYQVGGTSPFGLKSPMPIYVEATVLTLPEIFINGGKRGFLVKIASDILPRVLAVTPVEIAQAK